MRNILSTVGICKCFEANIKQTRNGDFVKTFSSFLTLYLTYQKRAFFLINFIPNFTDFEELRKWKRFLWQTRSKILNLRINLDPLRVKLNLNHYHCSNLNEVRNALEYRCNDPKPFHLPLWQSFIYPWIEHRLWNRNSFSNLDK